MSHSRVGVERDCSFELAFGKRKIPIVSQGNSAKHQVRIGQLIIQGDGFDGRFPGWQKDLARCAIRIAHVNIGLGECGPGSRIVWIFRHGLAQHGDLLLVAFLVSLGGERDRA